MNIGSCGYCRIKQKHPDFHCPVHDNKRYLFKLSKKVQKEEFVATSPGVFVGRYGYPKVNVGILSPGERDPRSGRYDDPRGWAASNMGIPKIVDLRSDLLNSRFSADVKSKDKIVEIGQEVALASRPADVEFKLTRKPRFRMKLDSFNAPLGPTADLKKAILTENPRISRSVDKVHSDTDLKASSALSYLYDKGHDENFLTKALSTGAFGVKTQRKLVPTRWGITAVDDMLFKHLYTKILDYKQSDHTLFFGGYLGNYYAIMFFPDVWSYELFETYIPKDHSGELDYMTDHEGMRSRKDYASNTVGGYYASRLAIAEKMDSMRRQASCLCLRFITTEYALPMGVWVVREATRKALFSKGMGFSDRELMLKYLKELVRKKFGVEADQFLRRSVLLKNIRTQKKLSQYFRA